MSNSNTNNVNTNTSTNYNTRYRDIPENYMALLDRYRNGNLTRDDVMLRVDRSDGIFVSRMEAALESITIDRNQQNYPSIFSQPINIHNDDMARIHSVIHLRERAQLCMKIAENERIRVS